MGIKHSIIDDDDNNDIWQNIYALMIHDKLRRNKKEPKTLYTMDDVLSQKKDKNLENYPINISNKKFKILTNNQFKKSFFNKHKLLQTLDFNNIVISGGSILSCFQNKDPKDLDIFIYGLSVNEAKLKVEYLLNYFVTYAESNNITCYIFKTKNLIRVYYDKYSKFSQTENTLEIQIIPRLYSTIAEIIYGFDLGSSAVAFNGNELLFSLMGKYSYVNKCNIVDNERLSKTYNTRIYKYFKRGFSIIYPFHDKKIKKFPSLFKNIKEYFDISYSHSIYDDLQDENKKKYDTPLEHPFIKKLLHIDDYPFKVFVSNNTYTKIIEKLIKSIKFICSTEVKVFIPLSNTDESKDEITTCRVNNILQKGIFNTTTIQSFNKLTIDNMIKLFDKELCMRILSDTLQAEKDWEEIINIRVMSLIEKIKSNTSKDYSEYSDVEWIVQNPDSQITGSFNPIVKNIREIYYYIDWYTNEKLNTFDESLYKYFVNLQKDITGIK